MAIKQRGKKGNINPMIFQEGVKDNSNSILNDGFVPYVFVGCWLIIVIPVALMFTNVEPYMDEIFHVPQAQRYCVGDLTWDSKITTFPGLYVITAIIHFPFLLSYQFTTGVIGTCSVSFIRSMNIFFGACSLLTMFRILRRFENNPWVCGVRSLSISLFPTHFFYTFLAYTDVGSVFFVLLAIDLILPSSVGHQTTSFPQYCKATCSLGIAVLFRQTNAVWSLFVLGTALLHYLENIEPWKQRLAFDCKDKHDNEKSSKLLSRLREEKDGVVNRIGNKSPMYVFVQVYTLVLGIFSELIVALGSNKHVRTSQPRKLENSILPNFLLILPVILFIIFVVCFNEGRIVMGDHTNHQLSLHWPQLYYCASLVAVPLLLEVAIDSLFGCITGSASKLVKKWHNFVCGKCSPQNSLFILSVYVLRHYSIAHPFLLSDNRHFTFYIWSKCLSKPWCRCALAPFHLIAALLVLGRVSSVSPSRTLWPIILLAACVLTLVPSPLLEPRYFTPPILIVHCHLKTMRDSQVLSSQLKYLFICCLFLAMNAGLVYVFVFRPFEWNDGSVARFMF